ncbi:DUF1330 domain-containing protein [Crossiella sp. NPDC003009]
MPAYVLVDAVQLDEEGALKYRALAEPSIHRYGGRYLVQGQVPEVAVGSWPSPERVVTVLEFPDMARLREWHDSPEYREAVKFREGSIELRMLFVEGKLAG